MDQIDISVQKTVKESSLSAAELAEAIGCGHQIFLNKINPSCDSNVLSLREAVDLIEITQDSRLLALIAHRAGYRLEKREPTSARDLLEAVLDHSSEAGDVYRKIREALEDGIITPHEEAAIQKEINETRGKMDALEQSVRDVAAQ